MSDPAAGPIPGAVAFPPDPDLRDVAVAGRLDAAAVLNLREAVVQACADGPVKILVNISGVTQVTASGLAGMLELLRLARARGGDVRLYGVSLAVADAQEASQLTSITRIYVHREQAAGAGLDRPALANPARSRKGPVRALRSIGASKGDQSQPGKSPAVAEQAPTQSIEEGALR